MRACFILLYCIKIMSCFDDRNMYILNTIQFVFFQIVPNGGLAFRWYLLSFACWTGRRNFKRYYKRACNGDPEEDLGDDELAIVERKADQEGIPISKNDNDRLIKDHGSKFVGWLVMVLGNYGQHAKAQQLYVTFISTYFGLSRGGVMTMGNLGLGSTKTFYDKTKAVILAKFDEKIRYYILLARMFYFLHFFFLFSSNY